MAGGWCWKKVTPDLRQAGHDIYTPTLTGLGERSHLAHPDIGLNLHVRDIVNVLRFEDLQNVILVGHSWGGMVITGVAEEVPERIARLVYLDAFTPEDGQSVFDINPVQAERWRAMQVGGYFPGKFDLGHWWSITDPGDVAWVTERLVPMPMKTHEDKIALPEHHASRLPRSYIFCTEGRRAFAKMAELARSDNWDYHELPTGHAPMVTLPKELADVLLATAKRMI